MKFAHLALTVIEDPDHEGRYHWLLLKTTGSADTVEEYDASEDSFEGPLAAFEAGAVRWGEILAQEDEDADPVGDGSVLAE